MKHTRGDVVVFPWQFHSEVHDAHFLIGVVSSVDNKFILCNGTLVMKPILSIYVTDELDVTRSYPDKIINVMSSRQLNDSGCFEISKKNVNWWSAIRRRESIADEIFYLHSRGDGYVGIL